MSVSYSFATPGIYSVEFWADDGVGNNVSDPIAVTVLDITPPTGTGTIPATGDTTSAVSFDATSITDNDPNFGSDGRYYWTFTDGTSQNLSGASQSYTFVVPGSHSVTLTVMDAAGNEITQTSSIMITDTTTPSGTGTIPASQNEDTSVAFSSSAITDNDPSFSSNRRDYWTFTDGTAQNLSGSTQSYTFNNMGTYAITLVVMDAAGNQISQAFSIDILDATSPSGTGSVPSTGDTTSAVSFSAAGFADNDASFGSNGRYYWTFTDGVARNLSGTSVSYTFSTPGSKTVTLLVMDAAGNRNSQTFTITITDTTKPVANAGPDQTVNEDTVVSFSASASTDNDPGFSSTGKYFWSWVDGSTSGFANAVSGTYTFNTPGTYVFTLLVFDAAGNWASDTLNVVVKDITLPTGSATVPASAAEDTQVTFSATGVTDNDPFFGGNRRDYWTFTDGVARNLSGSTLQYIFNTPGTFAINLLTMDLAGNRYTQAFTITISDVTPPVSSWTIAAGLTFNEDLLQTLTGAASTDNSGTVSNYTWAIQDTTGTTTLFGSSVTYTWNSPGNYTVTLTVRDPAGLTNALARNVTVRDITAPTGSGFVPSPWRQNNPVTFTAQNVTDNDPNFATTRRDYWTFTSEGALQNLSGRNVTYTFVNLSTYTITLVTMDQTGLRFSATFTLAVNIEGTKPVVTINSTNLSMSRSIFSVVVHGGVATDTSGIALSGWSFTENGVPLNLSGPGISGLSMTRRWDFAGTYTLTMWAMDTPGNLNLTTTTFTVTADTTPPAVSVIGPTNGDTTTVLTYFGTYSDNNPNCPTLCNLTWLRDGIVVANNTTSFTTSFGLGRHTVAFRVRDPAPAPNTATLTLNVDIGNIISVDTTWDSLSINLDYGWRIVNGATLYINNSTISTTTLGATAGFVTGFDVINGRLVIENSRFVAPNTTASFRLNASRDLPTSAVTVFINNSIVAGFAEWITVINGTISVRDSTVGDVRTANAGAFYALDSNLYLTNVQITATNLTTSNGVRAEFTAGTSVLLRKEIYLQNVNINSTLTPFRTFGYQFTGTIDIRIRDSIIFSASTLATVRGIDQLFLDSTGVVSTNIQNVNSQALRGGGIYSVFQLFNGTLGFTVADSNFSGSLAGNGTTFQLVDSSAQFTFSMTNVVTQSNSGVGTAFRFINNTANIGSWSQGTISMSQMSMFNNTLDGLFIQQSNARVTATIDIAQSTFMLNKRHGIVFDTQRGNQSAWTWRFTDVNLLSNTANGVMVYSAFQRMNSSFDFVRSYAENNTQNGFNLTIQQGAGFDALTSGSWWVNLTDSKFNTNTRTGLAVFENTSNSNNNVFVNLVRSSFDFNKINGFESIDSYGSQSYSWNGVWYAPVSRIMVTLESSSMSNNVQNGAFTSTYYCAYGTTNGTFPSACVISFNASRSHFDNNNGRGLFIYYYYGGMYGANPLFFNIVNDSTVNNNGMAGIYEFHYYTYMYLVVGGQPSDTIYNIVNSSLSYNGRITAAEGYGIYAYYYYDYYLVGQRWIGTDNASFIGNKNSGVRLYVYYGYYGNPFYRPNLFNSTFTDNGGAAYDPYYYYTYNCGICVQENVEKNYMARNTLGGIRAGIPDSAYRYFASYQLRYVNNTIDQSPVGAITSYVTQAYASPYYSGNNRLNISGNRITNVAGPGVAFTMDPPQAGGTVWVEFNDNYIENTSDTSALRLPGSSGVSHTWFVRGNTFINTSNSALLVAIVNFGTGNTGGLSFERNTFKNTAGTAFTLTQSQITMTSMTIRDSVFINSQIGLDLTGIQGQVRNATFQGSIKADIQLTSGSLEIHDTPVNPDLLVPVGVASFSVFFHLKLYVVWSGSLRPATGSIVEIADALGNTFFVGSVSGPEGIPEFESLSYTKNTQGVLGRSPFQATVNYFELTQFESIPLPGDRTVNILLRDDVAPSMVLASPVSGFATRGDTIQVEGTAYDSHSGFTYDQNDSAVAAQFVEVSTDNTNWVNPEVIQASTGDISFRLTLTGLTESVRHVYVRIHDEAGNYYTRDVPVVLDRTAPIVTILEEVPPITRASSVHIKAETELGTSVFVNGIAPAELLVRPDGIHVFFEMDVGIIEGPNTITVMAMDPLRNQGRVTIQVTADREAPYIVIASPEQDALVRGTEVMVRGHAQDRNGVSVKLNGMDAPLDADGNFSFPIPIAGDVTRIEAIATDGAGNTQILVRVVRFDEVAPWVTVENPQEGSLVGSTEVLVSGVVEQGATLVVNGETVDSPRGVFSRRILLVEGDNLIHIEATDSAGNKVTLDRGVTVDTHRPNILVTSIADDTLYAHPTVLLAGTVTDEHGVTLSLDGENVDVVGGAFSTEVALLEGTNVLHLIATDAAGNTARLDLQVVRDTTPPVVAPNVEGLVPDAGQYYTTQPAVSVVGIAEPGTIVEVCYTQEIGGLACNVVPLASDGSFRTYVDLLKLQKNTITVRGTDAAGNVASRDFSVTQSEARVVEGGSLGGAYGLLGVSLVILGIGGYFLMMSRKSRARHEEIASGDAYLAEAPVPVASHATPHMDLPPPPPAAPVAAPVVEQPTITTVPPEDQLVDAAPAAPADKPRMRPMRRRPLGGADGAETLSDKGTSAEGEAGPGESQPEAQKKEGEQ